MVEYSRVSLLAFEGLMKEYRQNPAFLSESEAELLCLLYSEAKVVHENIDTLINQLLSAEGQADRALFSSGLNGINERFLNSLDK